MNTTTLTEMRQAAQSANELDKIYVEFGGDPSDDKEVYKRYSSRNEKFNPLFLDAEVIECIRSIEHEKLTDAVIQLCDEVERLRASLDKIIDDGEQEAHATKRYLEAGVPKQDVQKTGTPMRAAKARAEAALKESNKRFG